MKNKSHHNGGSRTKLYFAGITAAVLAIFIYLNLKSDSIDDIETAAVQKGEFIVSVEVSGNIEAHRSVSIKGSYLYLSSLKIVKLAPEGETVKKGDFLIQFDTAELDKRISDYEKTLADKKGELEALIEQQKIDSVLLERQLRTLQLDLELARIDSAMLKYQNESKQRDAEINLRQKEIAHWDKLDEIANKKIENREKIKQKNVDLQRYQKLVDDYTKRREGAIIYAPVSGLVVHEEVRDYASAITAKIKVGSTVRYNYPLITLPDLTKMSVKAEINEVDFAKIKLDQEVKVTLDRNKKEYPGRVIEIAKMARIKYITTDTGLRRQKNVFDLVVAVEKDTNDVSLKPGMGATCKIITTSLPDVVFAPIQSVFKAENETFVYLKDGKSFKKTPVEVGLKNKDYIVIKKGIEPGQIVALRDPFSETQESGEK